MRFLHQRSFDAAKLAELEADLMEKNELMQALGAKNSEMVRAVSRQRDGEGE